MKVVGYRVPGTFLLLTLMCGASQAQNPTPANYQDAVMGVVSLEQQYAEGYAVNGFNPSIMTIPDEPFVADRTYTEWRLGAGLDEPLKTTTVTVARDRAGRIHYESSRQRGSVDVMISDPLAHTLLRYHVFASSDPQRPPRTSEVKRCLQPLMSEISRPIQSAVQPPASARLLHTGFGQAPVPRNTSERKDLGTRDIDGLKAFGELSTDHIFGPHFAQVLVSERWFAPELGLSLLDRSTFSSQNPYQTQTLAIRRIDPDPALFAPPPGSVLSPDTPSCIPHIR